MMGTGDFNPAKAHFLCGASRWDQAPETGLPELAIAGRSNSGKSSLVNFLLSRRQLARISSTPGRTQGLNFFCVDDRLVLVDLPGYGYARAPKGEVRRWTSNVREFIVRRSRLKGVILLLDIRRDPSADDTAFARLVRSSGPRLLPVVTKADKIPRGRRMERLAAIARRLSVAVGDLTLTSARAREGREELWKKIFETLQEGGGAMGANAARMVVAIDGPSGAGKSTAARGLAARLGWQYVDTGAMYRSIGLKADRLGVRLDDDDGLEALCGDTVLDLERRADGTLRILLDGEDVSEAIREHRVSDLASRVSARLPVREAMTRYQRRLGCAAPSVLEGRDVGTVVFPDAFLKVFLTASPEERALRRTAELRARGRPADLREVLRDIEQRDRDDSSRQHAPLRAAADAEVIDTTGVGADAVVDRLCELVERRRSQQCREGVFH